MQTNGRSEESTRESDESILIINEQDGTSKIGAISKAQKAQKTFFGKKP